MIKLIATDMDGTLLDGNKELPKDFYETIDLLEKKKIRFVIASGRSYVTLKKNFYPNADRLDFICDNGAYIVTKNNPEHEVSVIDNNYIKQIITECINMENVNLNLLLCGRNGTYHTKLDDESTKEINSYYSNSVLVQSLYDVCDDIFKVAICDMNSPSAYSYDVLAKKFSDELNIQVSGKYWMDVMNKGINKGDALKRIQEELDINYDETMSFGDYYNDIELLQQAKYSFVMKNANEDMFKYGNYVAKSNLENGVILAIKQFVL